MTKLKETAKIELIAFTAIAILAFILYAGNAINEHASIPGHQYYPNYWSNLLFSNVITCVCYFMLFFFVQGEMDRTDEQPSNTIILICLLINVSFIAGMISQYFAILLAIKMLSIYFTAHKGNDKHRVTQEALVIFAFSMFIHASAIIVNMDMRVLAFFSTVIPVAILHYLYMMHVLLPQLVKTTRPLLKFVGYAALHTGITYLVLLALIFAMYHDEQITEPLFIFNLPLQILVIPLLSWNIYRIRHKKDLAEIKNLKSELGKSDANLNFLKSQINPHFLFNALNTLYGTALQENAERTGEGIQKLGDMMRFMLPENMEDRISLSRDIDYLVNYIDLQKLRIATTENISIDVQIEEQSPLFQIAPMLLIPFVENAFKHGISLQNPSHIKITLQTKGNTLYLDVYNSIHTKKENDPEILKSGIGLQNVKQRLALQYPGQHELIIRESAAEFFIHLTIQLDPIN